MYATLTPGDPTTGAPVVLRRLVDNTGEQAMTLALWRTEHDAAAAGGAVWTVIDHHSGRAADATPVAAQVTWFHGPRSAEQVAADTRAGRERLWPAVQDAEGLVDVIVLQATDGASVVVGSATDAEHFAEVTRRIMSTTLLPGENPALLTGPDRLETYRLETATRSPR